MGIAILLFSLIVSIFHFQAEEVDPDVQEPVAAAPTEPLNYREAGYAARQRAVVPAIDSTSPFAPLVQAENPLQLAQAVADIITVEPDRAATAVAIAMAQIYAESTLGDVSLIAATATKAAPGEAASIAGAVARSLYRRGDPALAAAVATIVSLVPEQSREIGLVVGAVIGNEPAALGMVAQTVAIAVGEETFSSLSEGSGVSVVILMREGSGLGIRVPFDVPIYAAQMAPSASMVAGSRSRLRAGGGGT